MAVSYQQEIDSPSTIPHRHFCVYDVNVRCLDGNLLSEFRIVPFNGANWEDNIDRLRSSQEQNR